MTIREYLKSLGAEDKELTAKVVGRMENAMLIDQDLSKCSFDTVLSIVNKATSALNAAKTDACDATFNANAVVRRVNDAIFKANLSVEKLNASMATAKSAMIEDESVKDAVMAYACTLKATKDIFGDNIDTGVMVAAIDAGSYIAWRAIMEAKGSDEYPGRSRRRL